MTKPILERAAQELADATANPPFLYELGPEGARKVLDDLQSAPVAKPDVEEKWITVPAEVGDVPVRIVKPVDGEGSLPVVLFADGPFLTAKGMAWFWDCYTADPAQRAEITASPLRASLGELEGLPPALVIVDENDVLRDEGEAYARKLTQAGVPTTSIRVNGILHDFMMLNPLRHTQAATAAVGTAIHTLRTVLAASDGAAPQGGVG
ncbi:alpha/beta hydrolase fold domain-containing protein [Streptomyces wuyuanensis]|uniref:alpha/beta hydrolase fold domain-containing protein n=1 Tax=Streptomyces wuyuanensis TaxID=1196353 RepID=UPI0037174D2D